MAINHAFFFAKTIQNAGGITPSNVNREATNDIQIDNHISTEKYDDEGRYLLSISVRGTIFRERDAATVELVTTFLLQRDNNQEYSASDRKLVAELYHQAFCNCLDQLNYYCKTSQSGFALIEYYPIGKIYEDVRIGALEMPIF